MVQWHLETQNKSFISRLGAPILNLGISGPHMNYYSVHMEDNSVKVIRFDNNKVKAHIKSLQIDKDDFKNSTVVYDQGTLIIPHKNILQFYNIDDKSVQQLQVKPRNFISNTDGKQKVPETNIRSFCFTPDLKNLITFEELADKNSHKDIKVQALKFWSREAVEEDVSRFEVTWLVQNPCQDANANFMIEAINNKQVLIVNGSRIQVWGLIEAKKWSILFEFDYQSLEVLQILSGIKLRMHLDAKK